MYAIKCPYGISVPTANITDHLDSKKGYECTRIGETIQLTLQYNMFYWEKDITIPDQLV